MTDNYTDFPKVKIKTLSMFSKNSNSNNIFKFMTTISKNIYNSSLFVYFIYARYKNIFLKEIYDDMCNNKIVDVISINNTIYNKLDYFYNICTHKYSLTKANNNELYKRIIKKIETTLLNNDTYQNVLNDIIKENIDIKFNNYYE